MEAPKKATTSERIRAVARAMTEPERLQRFREIQEFAAQSGGILLDSDLTTELVILGSLLGIHVEWERVELPVYGKPSQEAAKAAPDKKGKTKQWEAQQTTPDQASMFTGKS
jgi:hypothetical protein